MSRTQAESPDFSAGKERVKALIWLSRLEVCALSFIPGAFPVWSEVSWLFPASLPFSPQLPLPWEFKSLKNWFHASVSPQRSQVRFSKGVVQGAAVPCSGTKSSISSHPRLQSSTVWCPVTPAPAPACSLLPRDSLRHHTLPDHSRLHLHSSLFSSPSKGCLVGAAPWPHS